MKTSLHDYFNQLPDPRIHRNKKHLLIDIIVLSIIAVLCGAESWNSIETRKCEVINKLDFLDEKEMDMQLATMRCWRKSL